MKKSGQVTIPTDLNVVKETLETMKKWGADAIRDCDGTEFPQELINANAKIYKTYYTTRKDNKWAKAHPDEIQQIYLSSLFYVAESTKLNIPLMKDIYPKMIKINSKDKERWWEVIDRTNGEVVSIDKWQYNKEKEEVTISTTPYHTYSVSFLAYIMWDPVHMYNAVTNNWDIEPQITFDVRQKETHNYSLERLKNFIKEHEYVDVIRFTTFFHLFTLIFDEKARERYVDWFGYTASVSPYVLDKFEKEVGYPFRAEFIIDEAYYNNQYRIPKKEYKDFIKFQHREVIKLIREFTDICHENNKEAMMFLGDHHIGVEPFLDDFKEAGIDAIVGSVGNGSTLRLISDIKGVKYTEGRFLPYFFPDTFHEGGNPLKEAKENWVTARRAILRKPIDRIGYGGYLSLALKFPDFMDYIESVCDEFRQLYDSVKGTSPYSYKKIAILNSWGKLRSWGAHMVHHALYQKQNYSYSGVLEALSGAPYDVSFISFDDVLENENIFKDIDVIITLGDADTAHTGGIYWENPVLSERIRKFVYSGGALIGIGEPSAHQYQGHFIQLYDILGVEKETGFTLGYDKYNWKSAKHFITHECGEYFNWGEGKKSIYALEGTTILSVKEKEVQMACKETGKGRGVYISGLPYSADNMRLLHRAILWATKSEDLLYTWFSSNANVEVNAYIENKKYCVVNNTYEEQTSTIYTTGRNTFTTTLKPNEIIWYNI